MAIVPRMVFRVLRRVKTLSGGHSWAATAPCISRRKYSAFSYVPDAAPQSLGAKSLYFTRMSMSWMCLHRSGASHASHLGCPSAYSSRLSYIKKRQVWKSRSETDWPHLGIMPRFSTEKNRSILMLTSTCWQEISLSNSVELTTVTPQKQKICCFKRRFLPVFENSRGSIVCRRAANLVMCHGWAVLSLRTSPFQCDSQQTYVKTKPPNRGASQDLLCVSRQWNLWNFRKLAKNDV